MRRPLLITAALAAPLLVTTAGLASAATAAGPARAASGAAPAVVATPADTTALTSPGVTIITGDSIRVDTIGGHRVVTRVPATLTGPGADYQSLSSPTGTYVVPTSAMPYVGGVLDVNLFNITALSKAKAFRTMRVTIGYAGSSVPKVPGVTVTSSSAGVAKGYLTPTSSTRFGTALAGQFTTDAKAGFPKRTTLFGATKISPALPPTGQVTPRYPMRTLIMKVTDATGAPATFGFVDVVAEDDMTKYAGFAVVIDGVARASVPLGTYGIDATTLVLDHSGFVTGAKMVVRNDYAVTSDGQTLTLDGRTATSRLSVGTPQRADQGSLMWIVDRRDAAGHGDYGSGVQFSGPASVYVNPVAAPAKGTLRTIAGWTLTASPLRGAPFAYSLQFPRSGAIAADQRYSVTEANLATLRSRLFVDTWQRQGYFTALPVLPDFAFGIGVGIPVAMPSAVDVHVNVPPRVVWLNSLLAPIDPANPFAGMIDDSPRLLSAGQTLTADWGRGPLVPNVSVETDGSAALMGKFPCFACRTNGKLLIGLVFATDTTPGHSAELFAGPDGKPVARLEVFRDGKKVFDSPDTGLLEVSVPARSATYKVVDWVNRVPSAASLSTTTTTELTFTSAAGQGGTMPKTWSCPYPKSTCTVIGLLKTSVDLPTNLAGSVPLGKSAIGLTVSHIAGAPTEGITSGTVEVRRGAGAWRALRITSVGNGRYQAALTTTAADAGTALDLRVTGTDAAGGKIVQTVIAAFTVSAT